MGVGADGCIPDSESDPSCRVDWAISSYGFQFWIHFCCYCFPSREKGKKWSAEKELTFNSVVPELTYLLHSSLTWGLPQAICCVCHIYSAVSNSVTLWTVAHQAPPLSMVFSRHEYWSGLPFPTPRDLPNPGIEPGSLASPAPTGGFFTTAPPGNYLLFRVLK